MASSRGAGINGKSSPRNLGLIIGSCITDLRPHNASMGGIGVYHKAAGSNDGEFMTDPQGRFIGHLEPDQHGEHEVSWGSQSELGPITGRSQSAIFVRSETTVFLPDSYQSAPHFRMVLIASN
jgi:hypothetical protein